MYFGYFFQSIFLAKKSRQKIVIFAMIGVFLSSFSLIVVQSVMNGLQKGLIERSMNVMGRSFYDVSGLSEKQRSDLIQNLKLKQIQVLEALEFELMLVKNQTKTWSKIIGLKVNEDNSNRPAFLVDKDFQGLILGSELSQRLKAYFSSEVKVFHPSYTEVLFGQRPRMATFEVSDFFVSELSEIDSFYSFIPLKKLQNLIRERKVNTLIFYRHQDQAILDDYFSDDTRYTKWSDKNQALSFALKLETNMMLFLFSCMSLLISLSITSGFLIFFDKVKVHLMSFWVLGLSRKKILQMMAYFLVSINTLFSIAGILCGLVFLYIIENLEEGYVPDFFLETKIPVEWGFYDLLVSFSIPFGVSCLFSLVAFRFFARENTRFTELMREVLNS